MAGYLARLQLKLVWRGVTATTGRIVTSAILLLYGLGMLTMLGAGIVALGIAEASSVRGPVLTVAMAAITLGWPVLAVVSGGDSNLLDPARFALMPRTGRELAPAMFAAAVLSPGALVVGIIALLVIVAWRSEPLPALLAAAQLVLGILTSVLLVRVVLAALGPLLGRRRVRERLGVVLLLGVIGAGVGSQFLSYDRAGVLLGPELLVMVTAAARIARWTPFGWCWSLSWDAQQGAWPVLLVHVVASLVLIVVLAMCWVRLIDRALVNPITRDEAARVKGSRLDELLPSGVMGALMGRELRYWRRDHRRFVQLISIVLVPLMMVFPAVLGDQREMIALVPFTCAVVTSMASAWGLSYDGSALWIIALSQVSAVQDRAARVAVVALMSGPVLIAGLVLALVLAPGYDVPGLVGMTVGTWLVSLGTGTWVDAMWQQPMPPPTASVFSRNPGSTSETFVGSMLTMIMPVLGGAPSVLLFILATVTGRPVLGWAGLAVGLLVGVLACWGGVVLAGRRLDRRWPEVLGKVKERLT